MKAKLLVVLVLLLVLFGVLAVKHNSLSAPMTVDVPATEHIYLTWDTMELDKCVSAWLIIRFIDKDAKFVFYPQGTEIKQGIVFDVPGAEWSRKHQKCTSDCILESLDLNNPVVEKIVSIAHQTELNFWQLDSFPEALNCFNEVKELIDKDDSPLMCFEKTRIYFDKLYDNFRKESK